MNLNKIIFWVSTGLLAAMMLFSAGMYFFNYNEVKSTIETLGYPSYIIYPLAMAKIIGVIIISNTKKLRIKEWVYAGFMFNFILAFFAHFAINDGDQFGAVIALLLLITSYIFYNRLNN